MYNGLYVDGKLYANIHLRDLKREGEMLDGQNTMRFKNGHLTRDIVGTFFNYSVVIDPDAADVEVYDELYEVLLDPDMESHIVVFPYGQGTLTFRAYVSKISDEIIYINGAEQRWGNATMKFVAQAPQRS